MNMVLNSWKAWSASGDQVRSEAIRLVMEVSGAATELKFLMNHLYQFAKPRKRCNSLTVLGCGQSTTATPS